MKKDSDSAIIFKESNRIRINTSLLGICFTLFTFLIAFNPDLLKNNFFITVQLVCAIPLIMTSLFSRTKAVYSRGKNRWRNLSFLTFLISYSFMLNVVGIFLTLFVSIPIGILFFATNITLALIYSGVQISYDSSKLKERFIKDFVFVLILILLGIFPGLNFY
jgi:hypothetical protein